MEVVASGVMGWHTTALATRILRRILSWWRGVWGQLFVERVMGASDAVVSGGVDSSVRRAGFAALYDDHVAEVYRFVHRRCRTMPPLRM